MQSPNASITNMSTTASANRATRPDIYSEIDSLHAQIAALQEELDAVKAGRITKNWYTRQEAADYLRISVTKLWELRASGRLPGHQIDGKPVFHITDLDAIAERDATTDEVAS